LAPVVGRFGCNPIHAHRLRDAANHGREHEVGIYAATTKIPEIWYFLPALIVASGSPSIIRCQGIDNALYLRRMRRSESGVIILDNSDRSEYAEAVAYLFEHGFRKLEFIGEISIFYRGQNIFGI
jgi:hypothetical protein